MSSGFSTTGAGNGTEQADSARDDGMAEVIFSTVGQRAVGAGVLSPGRDQRKLVQAMAIAAGQPGLRW